jgi:PAS domain S-box-containing protein
MDPKLNLEVGYGVAKGTDAYAAGAEAARQALLGIRKHPVSVALVFAAANYDLEALLQGIQKVMGEAPVIGATTAGEICNGVEQETVVVLVLASPYLRVKVAVGKNVSQDWQQSLIEAITAPQLYPYFSTQDTTIWTALTHQGKSAFAVLFSPGTTHANDSRSFDIFETLKHLSQGRLPILGANAADDWRLDGNYVFWGSQVFRDGFLVAVFETSLKFGISLAHGFRPTSQRALVTRSFGQEVVELNGRPAAQVFCRMLGLPKNTPEGTNLTLATSRPMGLADPYGQYSINVATFLTSGGGVRFTQPVPEGTSLTLMEADPDSLVAAGAEALRKALLRGAIKSPGVVLVFSSAFRSRLLGPRLGEEISGMQNLAPGVPVLGFYSYGEQGLADDGVNRHNNEVIAVLALGRELSYGAEVALENEYLRVALENQNAIIKMNARLEREIAERQATEKKLKKNAETLRKNEATLRGIFAAAPIGISLVNRQKMAWVNEQFTKMTGYAADELTGHSHRMLYETDEEFELASRQYAETMKRGRGTIETQWKGKDGRIIDVLLSSSQVNSADPDGDVIVTTMDITERKQAEEAFKSLVYGAPIGIFIAQDGKFNLVNPGFLNLTGYSEDELIGEDALRYVSDDFREPVRAQAIQMLKGERSAPYEFQIITKSGESRWVVETVTPIQYKGKRATLGFFMDVNEQAVLENQLLQSQKMEAVGRLAGGVAHDFNNMLTAIMGYCEIVMMSFREEDPIFLHLEGIRKSADRAATLTRQLLAFSRKQLLQPRVTNLNTVITDLEKMLHRLIGEDIDLVIKLESALKPVKADPGQIEQVIMNLVINARDAMPMGGKLVIQTANVYLDEAYTRHYVDLLPGDYTKVSVIDQGVGMAPETLAHVFEPFFTTKEAGKGTGLGLSTAYGIIKQSGGHIEVSSQIGGGTVFEIYLRQLRDVVEESPRPAAYSAPPQGSETVLVVEDEEILLELIRDALEMHGYQVLAAHNGMEAMELSRQYSAPIHLMLTDVVMPHKNGRELAEYLSPLHPEMKILYMSGYTEDAMVVRGLVEAALPFIQKPFPPMDLVRKVREMIDSPRN